MPLRSVGPVWGAWWAHLVGAFRVDPQKHYANHPPQRNRTCGAEGVAIIEVPTLHGWDRSAVDDDLTAMNRRGSRRDEEPNKLRPLCGSTGSTDGDPTERLHEPFASGRLVVPVLFCKALHHPMRRIGLDHAP